jgi:hypothetical protein
MPVLNFRCTNPDCNFLQESVVKRDVTETSCKLCKSISKYEFATGSSGIKFKFNYMCEESS